MKEFYDAYVRMFVGLAKDMIDFFRIEEIDEYSKYLLVWLKFIKIVETWLNLTRMNNN